VEVFVGTATLQHYFNVVFILGHIWGVLLHVDHHTSVHKGIIGESLAVTKGHALICVEASGKLVAIDNAEDSAVEVNVTTDIKVSPVVAFNLAGNWHKMSLQEDALGNSRVGDLRFQNMDGVIIEVIVDDTLAKAVVFVGVLDNWFLEVSSKIEDLDTHCLNSN